MARRRPPRLNVHRPPRLNPHAQAERPPPRNTTPAFRDALVLVDNVVEAVAGFLRKDSEEQKPETAPKS